MKRVSQSVAALAAVCGVATVGLAAGEVSGDVSASKAALASSPSLASSMVAVPVTSMGPVALGVTAPITLTAADGQRFELIVEDHAQADAPRDALGPVLAADEPAATMTTVSGRVLGGGSFVMSTTGAAVFGAIWSTEGNFEIRGAGVADANGNPLAQIVAVPDDLPACAGGLNARTGLDEAHAGVFEATPQPLGADTITRAFMVFSTDVAARIGTDAQVAAYAASAIASANEAYENSEINPLRLELAGYVVLDDPGVGFSGTLRYLTGRGEGFLDEALVLRDAYNADIVPMIVETPGVCGVAWLSPEDERFSSFSLSDPDCAIGNLTFAHEVGHNHGSNHDPDNAGGAFTDFGFGHRWNSSQGTFRSVMAFAPGSRVPWFSNPNVSAFGGVTGIPGERDNAQTHTITQGLLANYRSGGLDTTDCDNSGTPDTIEIATGAVRDDNRNGTPDTCDIAADPSLDCNSDGVLDAFQVAPRVVVNTLPLGPVDSASTVNTSIQGLAPASGPVQLTMVVQGDFNGEDEFFSLELGGVFFDDFLANNGIDCFAPHQLIDLEIDAFVFNSLLSGNSLAVDLSASSPVDPDRCPLPSQVSFRFDYRTADASVDSDGDGVLDSCAVPCLADYNGDGDVNVLDVVGFVAVWNAGVEGADYNEDGSINVLDVVDFINVWNAGCP